MRLCSPGYPSSSAQPSTRTTPTWSQSRLLPPVLTTGSHRPGSTIHSRPKRLYGIGVYRFACVIHAVTRLCSPNYPSSSAQPSTRTAPGVLNAAPQMQCCSLPPVRQLSSENPLAAPEARSHHELPLRPLPVGPPTRCAPGSHHLDVAVSPVHSHSALRLGTVRYLRRCRLLRGVAVSSETLLSPSSTSSALSIHLRQNAEQPASVWQAVCTTTAQPSSQPQ
jgi:hypothetical protein